MMGNMNSMNVFEKNIKNSMIDDDPRRHFFFLVEGKGCLPKS